MTPATPMAGSDRQRAKMDLMSDPDPALAEPIAPPPDGRRAWPTWLRRTLTAVVLVAAFALAVWGAKSSTSGEAQDFGPGIVALNPPSDAQAPRQTTVGADLQAGYDGRLVIDGIEIPESQMEGARDPATVDPKDLAENGLRPNNRNRVYFKPGPGKVIEGFDQGTVSVTLRYFKERQEATTTNTVSWTFRVI